LDKAEANDANDMSSSNFKIEVCDKFLWKCPPKDDTTEQINWLLWKIIQNMMLALWSLSILIMTIWAWFIILHNWKDEYLTTWKNIFMWWIYAMIIALGSYYLVSIIEFIIS
jgi:hypothetical protein